MVPAGAIIPGTVPGIMTAGITGHGTIRHGTAPGITTAGTTAPAGIITVTLITDITVPAEAVTIGIASLPSDEGQAVMVCARHRHPEMRSAVTPDFPHRQSRRYRAAQAA